MFARVIKDIQHKRGLMDGFTYVYQFHNGTNNLAHP
jgi:hypothetical protein